MSAKLLERLSFSSLSLPALPPLARVDVILGTGGGGAANARLFARCALPPVAYASGAETTVRRLPQGSKGPSLVRLVSPEGAVTEFPLNRGSDSLRRVLAGLGMSDVELPPVHSRAGTHVRKRAPPVGVLAPGGARPLR